MSNRLPVYLDCAATTPIEPAVLEVVIKYLRDEYGNAGSRTHEFGVRAKRAVERAREAVALVVNAQPDEVIFTSGATESNNLAILGLRDEGHRTGRKHIVSTMIEHKAVLEPLERMARDGFEVTLLKPGVTGIVGAEELRAALRPDTLLVSIMAVNNETGSIQPIGELADILANYHAYLHVDAAQAVGKVAEQLTSERIDLMSMSSHKIFGPKGVGALLVRRRQNGLRYLQPVVVGGGQERGLRSGTLPVALIAGFGEAARMVMSDATARSNACTKIRTCAEEALTDLSPKTNGDPSQSVTSIWNLSFSGVDGEAAIVALRDLVAISNGSACTSASYQSSHVLQAMGLSEDEINGALRLSWCHLTPPVPWDLVRERLAALAM